MTITQYTARSFYPIGLGNYVMPNFVIYIALDISRIMRILRKPFLKAAFDGFRCIRFGGFRFRRFGGSHGFLSKIQSISRRSYFRRDFLNGMALFLKFIPCSGCIHRCGALQIGRESRSSSGTGGIRDLQIHLLAQSLAAVFEVSVFVQFGINMTGGNRRSIIGIHPISNSADFLALGIS